MAELSSPPVGIIMSELTSPPKDNVRNKPHSKSKTGFFLPRWSAKTAPTMASSVSRITRRREHESPEREVDEVSLEAAVAYCGAGGPYGAVCGIVAGLDAGE